MQIHFRQLFVLLSLAVGTCYADERVLLSVKNPNPNELPTLGVWQEYAQKHNRFDHYLSASFPRVPGFTTDMWCYESDGISFVSARPVSGGRVEMRHAWEAQPWEILTMATPLSDGLELVARLAPIDTESAAAHQPIESYPTLNVCWQLRRAAGFCSKPDPYPQFFHRCFIHTANGLTMLHETERRPIPVRPATDKRNNPPWVQMYASQSAPADLRAGPDSWADYSPDRYALPIIGAVSRDGRYLTALATGAESVMSQAWHDCMHNNARWRTAADGPDQEWRIRLYVMENDAEALVTKFQRDFPDVLPWE